MKCEWKDGKLNSCRDMSEELILIQVKGDTGISYCPFCGANIRKPKPLEPVIKKSGETWVALFEGVDYLKTEPCLKEIDAPAFFYHDSREMVDDWKPFSQIEITDTIAKLRPMVIPSTTVLKGVTSKLIGTCRGVASLLICEREDTETTDLFYCSGSLATVKDLEE